MSTGRVSFKKHYHCPNCKYSTDRKNNLKRHLSTMHEDSEKVLECCDRTFANKAFLKEHVSQHHATEGYVCVVCQKSFSRKALLKRHLVIHDEGKALKCFWCDYSTCHKSNLDRHLKKHKNNMTDLNYVNYFSYFNHAYCNNNFRFTYPSFYNHFQPNETAGLSFEINPNETFSPENVISHLPNKREGLVRDASNDSGSMGKDPVVPLNSGLSDNPFLNHQIESLNGALEAPYTDYLRSFLMKQLFLVNFGYYHFIQQLL